MTVHIMIPARYASSRLPGKVLLPLAGKPMLQHVYERALESRVGEIAILCDDPQVEKIARTFCANVMMTSLTCRSGTERIIEAIQLSNIPDSDIIINLQADEPFIEAEKIRKVYELLENNHDIPMASLAHTIDNPEDLNNPNVVKVVLDNAQNAVYFSRACIPWAEHPQVSHYLRHIGLYAYRVGFLKLLHTLSSSPLQEIEKLEQLTVLYHGYKIKIGVCDKPRFIDINTAEDYETVFNIVR